MTSRAELSATIWRVSHPGTKRKPGKVIEARLTHEQATTKADELRKAGTPCVVNRV